MALKKQFKWMPKIGRAIREYNEGQKENSTNNNMLYVGKPRTGKNYNQFSFKEVGLDQEHLKVIEAHASTPTHLAEVLELMFPNGFFKRRKSVNEIKEVVDRHVNGRYKDPSLTVSQLEKLETSLQEDEPPKCIDLLEDLIEDSTNHTIREKLLNILRRIEEIRDIYVDNHKKVGKNNDMPGLFNKAFYGGGVTNFNVKVLAPISLDMPSELPNFFNLYGVPVDDYKQYGEMDWGLRIIHGEDAYRARSDRYDQEVVVGETSVADLMNIDEDLDEEEFVDVLQYGDDKKIERTSPPSEKQSAKAFRREWGGILNDGVMCSSGFDRTLRPQLREMLLDDETEVIVLYTGFLRNKKLKKFVMTHFLETYKDVIEGISGSDVEKLDRKFVLSMIEAQDVVKKDVSGVKVNEEDKIFNRLVRNMMDNSGHFNTDFWFDVKPGYVHRTLFKSNIQFMTQIDRTDYSDKYFKELDDQQKSALKKAFVNDFYTELSLGKYGPGFALGSQEVPQWSQNGRTTYGYRLPWRRMTTERPLDEIGGNDFFSFFVDELGWDTIDVESIQDELFQDDWDESFSKYIEKKREEKQKEKEQEEQEEKNEAEMRQQLACEKLQRKVEELGGVPSTWKSMHEEILDELPDHLGDVSVKTIEEDTKELRNELEENFDKDDIGDVEVEQVADELKTIERRGKPAFVYGANSGNKKQTLAKRHILDNYDVDEGGAESIAEEAVEIAVMDLQLDDIIDESHRVQEPFKDNPDEYRELMGMGVGGESTASDDVDDSGDGSSSSPGEDPGRDEDAEYVEVEITGEVPEFTGVDRRSYGPFDPGASVELPVDNAEILVDRGKAVRGSSGEDEETEVDVLEDAVEEDAGSKDSGGGEDRDNTIDVKPLDDVEEPGKEWTCSCGRLNQEDRIVCSSCGKCYENVDAEFHGED